MIVILIFNLSKETGLKTYFCGLCNLIFENGNALSGHNSRNHRKVHLCDICGNAYAFPKYLADHKKAQHGEKDLPCEICGKKFASKLTADFRYSFFLRKLSHLQPSCTLNYT